MRQLLRTLCLWLFIAVLPAPILAQQAGHPQAVELPAVFTESFLNFAEDAADAARQNKRLLLYFGQDGCPYCKELLETNFSQKPIADLTRQGFVALGLNIWGDRETTWFDGVMRSEKDLARFLKVQFTPTVLLLDEQGAVIARINGYYPPSRFLAALDYAASRRERQTSFAEHMQRVPPDDASQSLNTQDFFLKTRPGKPLDLRRAQGKRAQGKRALAVLFETRRCAPCDELHREAFKRPATLAALRALDVARFGLFSTELLITPDGRRTTADAWARTLNISYTPSVVFFDDNGKEVFRLEAYVRPFHFASSFDYVGSGGYRQEKEFQRWLQNRAEHLKADGKSIDLWK